MDFTGVALGSGVNQYMKMDEMARANKKLEMEKALADQQMEKGNMELDRLRQADAAGKTRKAVLEAFDSGDWTNPALQSLHKNYNGNVGSLNDGLTADHVGFDKSGAPMFAYKNADGAVTATRALTRADVLNAANNQYFDSISTPELLMQQRQLSQKDRELGIMDKYRDNQGRLIDAQVGLYGAQARNVGAPAPMNPYQAYQLQQMQNFEKARGDIVSQLESGKITQDEATKRLNFAGMKYGGHIGNGNAQSSEGRVKVTLDNGMEFTGTPDQANAFRLQHDPVARAGAPGNNGYAMQDPRKPVQGTGLKTPQAAAPKVSADQQAKDFSQKYQGWTRQKAGNDFIVVGPKGERMWAADFDEQNGPNASLMLNYR